MNKITKNIFCLILVSSFTEAMAVENGKLVLPRIMPSSQVVLGASVTASLKNHIADFKLYELSHFSKTSLEYGLGHPMAVVGDFNDDGFRDIVFYGYSQSQKKSLVLGAISDGRNKNYKIHEILSYNSRKDELKNNPQYIKAVSKKSIPIAKRDYVQIETYGVGNASALGIYFSTTKQSFERLVDSMD